MLQNLARQLGDGKHMAQFSMFWTNGDDNDVDDNDDDDDDDHDDDDTVMVTHTSKKRKVFFPVL